MEIKVIFKCQHVNFPRGKYMPCKFESRSLIEAIEHINDNKGHIVELEEKKVE